MIYSIEQIARMRKDITPGKWTYREQANGWADWGQPDPPPVYMVDGPSFAIDCPIDDAIDHEPDAEFITAAPEIVDFLLARIAKVEEELRMVNISIASATAAVQALDESEAQS